ncbi:MAG: LemA family protein, partial [Halanaerobiales bacterium]
MWILISIIVLLLLIFIFLYNRLVILRQRVKNSWSQVDVQLKRRYDLIPNLVNVVKAYAKHE